MLVVEHSQSSSVDAGLGEGVELCSDVFDPGIRRDHRTAEFDIVSDLTAEAPDVCAGQAPKRSADRPNVDRTAAFPVKLGVADHALQIVGTRRIDRVGTNLEAIAVDDTVLTIEIEVVLDVGCANAEHEVLSEIEVGAQSDVEVVGLIAGGIDVPVLSDT